MPGLATALLPLRRYADFRGRSTRTEVISFSVLAAVVSMFVFIAAAFSLDFRMTEVANLLFGAALLCPMAALLVRRLHDQGRSGRWLLVLVPGFLVGLVDEWRWTFGDFETIAAGPSIAEQAVNGLTSLALLAIAFLPDEEAPNRYGPNPRYDAPGEPG